jgi:hypothetical protein
MRTDAQPAATRAVDLKDIEFQQLHLSILHIA